MKGNVFVVGHSASGKTTFARALCAKARHLGYVSAGAWAVDGFATSMGVAPEAVAKDRYRAEITGFARVKLAADPDVAVRAVKQEMMAQQNLCFVIDGLRNPRDFMLLFNPCIDGIVFVDSTGAPAVDAWEETGMRAIRATVEFMLASGIIVREQMLELARGLTQEKAIEQLYQSMRCG